MFWAKGAGTSTISGFWNVMATGWIDESGLREREATHVFALLDAAMMDAAIGCFDAKVTYWFIRPPQADPAIKLIPAIGLPNHPSYPSAHSCFSGAAVETLSAFFPAKTDSLNAMVTEAGLARIYAGIHYRFDVGGERAHGACGDVGEQQPGRGDGIGDGVGDRRGRRLSHDHGHGGREERDRSGHGHRAAARPRGVGDRGAGDGAGRRDRAAHSDH